MSKFNYKKWKDVLKIVNGKNQKNIVDPNGKYPIYGSGGIMAYGNNYLCNENTIIIGRKGSINNPVYVETKFWNVDTAFGISAGKELNSKFLYYFCVGYDFTKHNKSATVPSLTKSDLLEIKMPVPSLFDQNVIVLKLENIFNKINNSIYLIKDNIKYSQALINSIIDEEFKKLEIKYKKRLFSEIVTVLNGRAFKQEEMFNTGKYPILRVGNFFSNRGWYYSNIELDETKYCEDGDLLFAWSASFGPKIWNGEKSIYHYHIWKLVPTFNKVSKKYLYYLLERDTAKIKEDGGRGLGMMHITKGDFEKRMMALPPLEIQDSVVSRIEKLYDLHDKITNELNQKFKNMEALKNSLLDRAFKGEL